MFFYDGVDKQCLRQMDKTNLTVLSVGSVPEQAIHTIVPDLSVNWLVYGVEDTADVHKNPIKYDDRVCFVTIGYIIAGNIAITGRNKEKSGILFCGSGFVGYGTANKTQNSDNTRGHYHGYGQSQTDR